MTSRLQHIFKNFGSGLLLKSVDVIFPFIIKTLLIKFLGVEYLGLNGLFSSVLQVLNLAELGVSSAIVFSLYEPIAKKDYNTIGAIYSFYKKTYRYIGTVIATIGLLFMPFLPYTIKSDVPVGINIYILYCMYLFDTCISYFLFAYKECLLTAYQISHVTNNINCTVHILRYLFQIIAIVLFHNYYFYVVLIPFSTIAINLYRSKKVNSLFPQIRCEGFLDEVCKKDIYKRVSGLAIYKISDVCRDSFATLIISSFLGLRSLALFQNYLYIVQAINMILSMLISSMTASIGDSVVREEKNKNYSDFKNVTFVYFAITCVCMSCLACLYQPFMILWLGKKYLFNLDVVFAFCFYFLVLTISKPMVLYRYACGIWWQDRIRPIVEILFNLIFEIIFVHYFGVLGVLISIIMCYVLIDIPWGTCVLFKVYFKRSTLPYLLSVLAYSGISVLVMFLAFFISDLFNSSPILNFMIRGLISVCVSSLFVFILAYVTGFWNKTIKRFVR